LRHGRVKATTVLLGEIDCRKRRSVPLCIIMTGLDPVIHVLQPRDDETWMAVTSTAMTISDRSDSW